MTAGGDFISVQEASRLLDVSVQHVRRLADAGALTKVARGLIDRSSLERYQAAHRETRTRAWAEHTAWGAIALLSGHDASWLGASQASRLRRTLHDLTEPAELLVRARDRARVRTYAAHTAAFPRLRGRLAIADLAKLGIVEAADDLRLDGYLATDQLELTVRDLGLRAETDGNVTIRVTDFDFDIVAELVTRTRIVAALDAATYLDPRIRGAGERTLQDALDGYR